MTAAVLERSATPTTRYRADIDGLRAVAILLVVAYHAGSESLAGGYVGVDVFFVVSGYLITGLLLRELDRTGSISLRDFYARRARRLLPLASLVLLSTAAFGAWLLPPLARADLIADVRASALYVANWRFSRLSTAYSDVDVAETPLVHFWSLAIEEQFYVLWPLLIVAAIRYSGSSGRSSELRRTLAVLLAVVVVASLAASILLTPRLDGAAYYVTHTRLWELGIGGGLALALPRLDPIPRAAAECAAAIGLVAVIVSGLVYDAGTAFPGYAAVLPVAGTLLLIVAGTHPRAGVSRLLALRPMPALGRWSYAWYLWHWPALGFLTLANERRGEPLGPGAVVAWAVLGSLALAGATHHLVENPLRHARSLRLPRRSLAVGAGLTLLPIAAVTLYLTYGDVGATVVEVSGRASADDGARLDPVSDGERATSRWSEFDPPTGPVSPAVASEDVPTSRLPCIPGPAGVSAIRDCVFGDPDGSRTVLLAGDSHAAHWLPALHEVGARRGWRVLLATMGSCAVTDVPIVDDGNGRPFTRCHRFRDELLDEIEQLGPLHAVVIGKAAHVAERVLDDDGAIVQDPDALFRIWRLGSQRTYERLLASTEHIVQLRDTPGSDRDVPGCLSASPDDPGRCDLPLAGSADDDAVLYAAEAAAASEHVHLVDPTWLVCSRDPCRVVTDDGTIKFRDRAHLTSRFARQLAPRFDALLPGAVRD